MEAEDIMELRDLPVDTRNYTIIDNITGKPIEQSNYSLTIDPEVIGKLNELKRVNEEKIKQASLKSQYGDDMLVDTFTPQDNSVFTPVYEGEYINAQDFNATPVVEEEKEVVDTKTEEKEEVFNPTEVLQSETLLDRVVARDPSARPTDEEPVDESEFEKDPNAPVVENIENVEAESAPVQDNSTFRPEMTGLQQASEQIVKIDADKLGPAIKPPKDHKIKGKKKIPLDKMEIREAKGYAWLAYILFFLPMLINKKNRFVRVHANEGLDLNIMELLGAILVIPYFVLTDLTGTLATVTFVCVLAGVIILGMCAITIIPMMLCSMFGLQFQIPWLWKKRLIKVSETRE